MIIFYSSINQYNPNITLLPIYPLLYLGLTVTFEHSNRCQPILLLEYDFIDDLVFFRK